MRTLNDDIEQAFQILKSGGSILYPTDTVWGIGCDAGNSKAVQKISRLKRRSGNKSFIVLLDSTDSICNYVEQCPEHVLDLINKAGKPLTVIFPGGRNVVKEVLAEDGSIAIRVVKHPFCTPLIRKLEGPLLSTSANISGGPTPITFAEIPLELIEKVDYVAEHFRSEINQTKPSSIIRYDVHGNFEVIRP